MVKFSLSLGNAVDAVEGRLLLARVGPLEGSPKLLMDRAYENDEPGTLRWYHRNVIDVVLGRMTRNYISGVMRLSAFFGAYKDSAVYVPVTTNSM
jgi:hypothetical protein